MVKSASTQLRRAIAILIALMSTLACSLVIPGIPQNNADPAPIDTISGPPQVELTTPLNGAVYLTGVSVNITARVTNAGDDVDRVEILVDNQIVTTVPAPNPTGAPAFTVSQSWTAGTPGDHTIGLMVFRSDGTNSEPVSRSIKVVESLEMALAAPADAVSVQTGGTGGAMSTESPTLLSLLIGLSQRSRQNQSMVDAGSIVEEAPTPDESTTSVTVEEPTATNAPPTETEEPTAEPTAAPTSPVAVVLVGANVRSGPGTAFAQIGSFAAGTETPALAVTTDRSWYKVTYWNGEGWVSAGLLDVRNGDNLPIDDGPPPPTAVPTAVPTEPPPPEEVRNVNLVFNGSVTIDPFPPTCKQTMKFTAQIANDGSDSSGSSAALLIRDIHIGSGLVTETTAPIPEIGPGDVITVSDAFLTVDTNFDSNHKIEVIIDSNGQVSESNEGDNTFTSNEYKLETGDC